MTLYRAISRQAIKSISSHFKRSKTFVSGIKEKIPVEIQIRTVAMDYWASLEHQIYYKRGCDGAPEEIIKRLKDCADTIASVDIEMQNINRDLEMRCSKDVTPE